MSVLERFLRYVKIDTMSSEENNNTPSTNKQFDLANLLVQELKELGLEDAYVSDKCIVTASLKSNDKNNKLKIGFNSHLDTIPGFSGTNVKPRIIENYDGKDIELNQNLKMDVETFPFLPNLKGKTLIVTDGNTVLGADDKAGIAIIMDMLEYYKENPNILHTEIQVAFTPDEEIGAASFEFIDFNRFKPDFAYTLDGHTPETINYECFNATKADVLIKGLDIHPGTAKGKMINAIDIATEFNQMLPKLEKPMYREGYEGFIHLTSLHGEVGLAKMEYILREHDLNLHQKQQELMKDITNQLNQKYGDVISLELTPTYPNMGDMIKKDMRCVNFAKDAMARLGIEMKVAPMRGGTDGAMLTRMGINTPNLGTGGYNCHGPYEFACLDEMLTLKDIIIEITKIAK